MSKPSDNSTWGYMFSDNIKFVQKIAIFHPDRSGRFLTLQRSTDSPTNPNKWDLVGGNVLFGQDAGESLAVEILEEAGLSKFSEPTPIYTVGNMLEGKDVYRIYIGYVCIALTNDVIISHEHQDHRWVTKEEFLELDAVKILKDTVNKIPPNFL